MSNKKEYTPGSIRVVEMSATSTDHPIVNAKSKKWVEYGGNNTYPDYLLDLFLQSPTQNAIVTAFTQMVAGDGLEVTDAATNPLANTFVQTFFSPEKLKKIAFNLKLYGYAPVVIKGGNRVTSSYVSDALKWRSGKKDENGKVNEWWFSEDWEDSTNQKNKPQPYPVFSYDNIEDEQVYVFLLPMVGLDYYPPVDYNGGTSYVQLEVEISEFHLSAIQNGLYPGTMINFNNGIPPDDEQDQIEKKVARKFGGSSKAGRFFLSFNDDKESAATLDVIPQSDIDKQYEFLSTETTTKIMLAHRVTSPIMFGIRGESGLGNNAEELKDSFRLYFQTVVRPYQEIILDGVQEIVFKNNLQFESEWIDFNPFGEETPQPSQEAVRTPTLHDLSSVGIDSPEGYKLLSKEVWDGSDRKTNGSDNVVKLYQIKRAHRNTRNVTLKLAEEKDNYFDYAYVKDHPNNRDMYWEEHTFIKIKK